MKQVLKQENVKVSNSEVKSMVYTVFTVIFGLFGLVEVVDAPKEAEG